jgi:hypothetical protein
MDIGAVIAVGLFSVTEVVVTLHPFTSVAFTVYVPAGMPVKTPVVAPVTLPGICTSRYERVPVPPDAVTVILPSDTPVQLIFAPL